MGNLNEWLEVTICSGYDLEVLKEKRGGRQ